MCGSIVIIRAVSIKKPVITSNSYYSRIRESKGAFSDCFFILSGLLLVVSHVYGFVPFLEAVGVREYCCMAVECLLEALCFVRSREHRPTSPRPSGLVALDLDLARSLQSYVAGGVALSREPRKL